MRALLIQHRCEAPLEVLPVDMEAQIKFELNKKAHNTVILCLGNKVLREVTGETTVAGVWSKLETLYMTKSLDNKLGMMVKGYMGGEDLIVGIHVSQREGQERSLKVEDSSSIFSNQLGDNRECKIRGIGKVRIQLRDGSSFVLNNVRYIPELKKNLISLGTLEKEGFTIKLQSGKVKVINGSKVVLSRIRRDNCVYSLDGHAIAGELNVIVKEKDSLAQVESLGCKRYFLFIVDDYSKRVWVYIPSFKHQAFGKFKKWKQLVENQTRRTIKKLRMDNGLELCNRKFKKLCIESGIVRQLIVSRTP
nr:retrovirus-related Pol polyprotein from transposon TNT 1-94 [Tanacetum cinerariifolium]